MQVAYCENCGKHTGHKRELGIMGKVTAIATVGANHMAYTPRCIICGLTTAEAHNINPAVQAAREVQRKENAELAITLLKLPFQMFWWLAKQIGKGMLRIDTAIRARNAPLR
jgi:hypothetical protein